MVSLEQVIALAARINSVGVIISCAEYLACRQPLRDSGLMSWSVSQLRYRWSTVGTTADVLSLVLGYPGLLYLLGARLVLAVATLIYPGPGMLSTISLILQAALAYLFLLRSRYGHDGADQMSAIILASLGMAYATDSTFGQTVCVWFLALQLCLAYCVAGVAKASAPGWRDGSFLTGVCGLQMYGNARLARWLASNPRAATFFGRSVVLWEMTFPLALILPSKLAFAWLALGLVFHIMNAVVMGLNTFVWSFIALYPPLLYARTHFPSFAG